MVVHHPHLQMHLLVEPIRVEVVVAGGIVVQGVMELLAALVSSLLNTPTQQLFLTLVVDYLFQLQLLVGLVLQPSPLAQAMSHSHRKINAYS